MVKYYSVYDDLKWLESTTSKNRSDSFSLLFNGVFRLKYMEWFSAYFNIFDEVNFLSHLYIFDLKCKEIDVFYCFRDLWLKKIDNEIRIERYAISKQKWESFFSY